MSDQEVLDLELERKQLEYQRVRMGMLENQFKIKERMADIRRLESNIEISKQALEKIAKDLADQGVMVKS